MKGIIIYKGKYGATRQYAEWIAEKLGIPLVAADDILSEQLGNYDYIILGSSVYIGKLQITKWLKENQAQLSAKRLFLFVVSGTPPGEIKKLNTYIDSSVPPSLKPLIEIEFLHGKMKVSELSWRDRFLLRLGALLTKDPVSKRNMLANFNNVKKENLDSLLQKIHNQLAFTAQEQIEDPVKQLSEYF